MNFEEVREYLKAKNIHPSKLVKFSYDSQIYEFLGLSQESFSAAWLVVLKPLVTSLSDDKSWKLIKTHFSNIEVI